MFGSGERGGSNVSHPRVSEAAGRPHPAATAQPPLPSPHPAGWGPSRPGGNNQQPIRVRRLGQAARERPLVHPPATVLCGIVAGTARGTTGSH
jgi:hypothetical protein